MSDVRLLPTMAARAGSQPSCCKASCMGPWMGLADADFAGDHDGLEIGPQAGCVDLEVLEVGGAVGDQPERQAAGEFGQQVGGVGEHGVALAAFVAEAFGQLLGVGRIVDAVLCQGAAPGFAAIGGRPGVQPLGARARRR